MGFVLISQRVQGGLGPVHRCIKIRLRFGKFIDGLTQIALLMCKSQLHLPCFVLGRRGQRNGLNDGIDSLLELVDLGLKRLHIRTEVGRRQQRNRV